MADKEFNVADFVEVEAYERNGKTVRGYVRRVGGSEATPEETEKFYAAKYGDTQSISKNNTAKGEEEPSKLLQSLTDEKNYPGDTDDYRDEVNFDPAYVYEELKEKHSNAKGRELAEAYAEQYPYTADGDKKALVENTSEVIMKRSKTAKHSGL